MVKVAEKLIDRIDPPYWTFAHVISVAVVLEMEKDRCRTARVVLGGVAPIPWRLPEVERLLTGQQVSESLAARAGEMAVSGARPLAKNRYKIPLTKGVVRRTILDLATRA